jgi:hypothetical protein
VQPDAAGAVLPGLRNGRAQEVFAQAPTEVFREQAEVGEFRGAVFARENLEVTRRLRGIPREQIARILDIVIDEKVN